MEKALEILNNIYFDDRGIMCVEKNTALDLFNAISELEEAMKTKTCEMCKFKNTVKFVQVENETLECCSVCVRQCYDYFEPKDKV